jgi:hypothetical protein
MTDPTETLIHGRSRYTNHRCRCATCTEANRLYQRAYMRRRRAAGLVTHNGKRLHKGDAR